MESTAHLLINLIGILVSLLVFQYFLNKLYLKRTQLDIITFLSLTVSILTCMLFPLNIPGGIVFDLRLIPFIIGCFYANAVTRYWIILLIIGLRLNHGVEHSWFAIINVFLFYLIISYFRSKYSFLSKVKRISLLTILMLFMSLWSSLGVNIFFHSQLSRNFLMSYILIQSGGILIVGYMVESIIAQHIILHKMVRMKKIEVASHLAASISHEVRNPLTSTRGFLQLLSESQDLSTDHKDYINIAIKELDDANSIIRRYLTFAKPTPEKLVNFDVKMETERVIQVIEPLAKMNSVDLISNIESSLIIGDAGLFQQAMVNIIQNGIEAMPSGGTLSILGFVEKSNIHITITDEGTGMNILQMNRLGEPYFSTNESKGTGLGMMVVFQIIESMNGKIKVDSKLGKGTQIMLQFPIKELGT